MSDKALKNYRTRFLFIGIEQELPKFITLRYPCQGFDTILALHGSKSIEEINMQIFQVESLNKPGKNRTDNSFKECNHKMSLELVSDRLRTLSVLKNLGLPVPLNQAVYFSQDLENAIAKVGGYPVIIKPLDAISEAGTTPNINNLNEARAACKLALPESKFGGVLVEKFYPGYNYKILVVNGRAIRAIEFEQIDRNNALPTLKQLTSTDNCLDRDSVHHQPNTCYKLNRVNELVYPGVAKANKIVRNFTDKIHWKNIYLAQIVAAIVGLNLVEVEMVSRDLSLPLNFAEEAIVNVSSSFKFNDYFL